MQKPPWVVGSDCDLRCGQHEPLRERGRRGQDRQERTYVRAVASQRGKPLSLSNESRMTWVSPIYSQCKPCRPRANISRGAGVMPWQNARDQVLRVRHNGHHPAGFRGSASGTSIAQRYSVLAPRSSTGAGIMKDGPADIVTVRSAECLRGVWLQRRRTFPPSDGRPRCSLKEMRSCSGPAPTGSTASTPPKPI